MQEGLAAVLVDILDHLKVLYVSGVTYQLAVDELETGVFVNGHHFPDVGPNLVNLVAAFTYILYGKTIRRKA